MTGYLSVRKMAQVTGLSEERIRQLIRLHQIKYALKLGGWLVKEEDFQAFLKTRFYGPHGLGEASSQWPLSEFQTKRSRRNGPHGRQF